MNKKILVVFAIIIGLCLIQPVFSCRWRRYDLNHDGKVDMQDIVLLTSRYGLRKGQDGYFARYDFNHDKAINIYDIVMMIRYYGLP